MPNNKGWVVTGILMLVAFALFANTFGHQWTYDDYPVIVDNPDVRSWANFLADDYPGRPLRELTYLFDHALFGLDPAGYHVQSIFWHGLAAVLLALLAARAGLGWMAGALGGLLFLVHPITVEAVANISHRKESLVLCFAVLALLAYQSALKAEQARGQVAWCGVSLLLVVVACYGKQTAVVVPLLLLAYEWTFVERSRWLLLRAWKLYAALVPVGLVAAGVVLTRLDAWARYDFTMRGILQYKANYFDVIDLEVYARTVLKSWAFSAYRLAWPLDLAVEYAFPVPAGWLDGWVLAGLALLTTLLGGLLWLGLRRSPAFVWLVMAVLFFLPVSNIWPLAYLSADRYLYIPWAALAMLLAWTVTRMLRHAEVSATVCVLVALPLAWLTWQQNRVWADRVSLWTHAYTVSPNSSFVINNMGNIQLEQGNLPQAAGFYQRALETNPLNPSAWYNLGIIFERRNNMRLALQFYQKFIDLNNPHWRREIAALQERLQARYGIRLQPGPFDPSLPVP